MGGMCGRGGVAAGLCMGERMHGVPGAEPCQSILAPRLALHPSLIPRAHRGSWHLHPSLHGRRHREQTHSPLADTSFICQRATPKKGFQGIEAVGKQPPLPAAGRRARCCGPRASLGHWHPPAPLGIPWYPGRKGRASPSKRRLWDPDLKSSAQGNISAKEPLLVYSKRATFFYVIF